MGSERPDKKKEKKEKKRSETDGVHKKSKKDKKNPELLGKAVEQELATASETPEVNGSKETQPRPIGALVPFANPLAEEKVAKKVLKSVKKGNNSPLKMATPAA